MASEAAGAQGRRGQALECEDVRGQSFGSVFNTSSQLVIILR